MNSEYKSFDISYEYSLWQDLFVGIIIFNPVTLTYFLKTNLANNFEMWVLGLRYLIWVILVTRPGTIFFYPFTLEFDLSFFELRLRLLNNKY